METRRAFVDRLEALGEPRLEREILAKTDQRIEQEVRHLQRRDRQLLVRIERGRIGIVGHAQSLGRQSLGLNPL